MPLSCEELDKVAPKLNGNKEGTFAYKTVNDRWPKIVTKLVDFFKVEMKLIVEKYGDNADEDVRSIMEQLSKLRYLIMTDKPLENLTDNGIDAALWNNWMTEIRNQNFGFRDNEPDKENLTWYKGDWLFNECYLYRFIYGAVYATIKLRDFDYFEAIKQENFNDHLEQVEESCNYLLSIVAEGAPVHETFGLKMMIKMSLWGNRADMSLTGGDNSVLHQSAMAASTQRDQFVLVDDIDRMTIEILYPLLKKKDAGNHRRIDIVLDNAGIELVGDLLLAEYFISMKFADKIHLHGKSMPWFVSDVTKKDFHWVLKSMVEKTGESGKKMAERILKRIENGELIFESHPFWTYPHAYFEMARIAPDLYEDLQKSSLIFFKGDLNYRKLVGDRDWDLETTFKTATREFKPCPFMALRTLKAETVAGLPKDVVDDLIRKYDDDNSWMTSGEYAVCQLGGI